MGFYWNNKSPQVPWTLLYSGRSQQCYSLDGLHYIILELFITVLADGLSMQSVTESILKSPDCILAVINNVVVWMASNRPPTSKSCPFSNPLVAVPNAPITIGIIVTFMFHSFLKFPCKVELLILLFTFFQFYSVVTGTAKSTILQVFFFLKIWSSDFG